MELIENGKLYPMGMIKNYTDEIGKELKRCFHTINLESESF